MVPGTINSFYHAYINYGPLQKKIAKKSLRHGFPGGTESLNGTHVSGTSIFPAALNDCNFSKHTKKPPERQSTKPPQGVRQISVFKHIVKTESNIC